MAKSLLEATPGFNFAHVGTLMHRAAFVQGAPSPNISRTDYSAFCDAMQAVEDATLCLKRTEAGISTLLNMLGGADVEPYFVEAMRGLLGPIAHHLEHHSKALAATIAE